MSIAEKLQTIAENEQKVFDAGYEKGKAEGGGDSYYDTFWDSFQDNGNRRTYMYGFAGTGWTPTTFKPKYPIIVKDDASYMFAYCDMLGLDFVENGIELDISGATTVTYMFRYSNGITRVGVLDFSNCKELNRPFYSTQIKTIDCIIVHENLSYTNTFDYSNNLENLTVSGTIGKSISFTSCQNLTADSVQSIIDALITITDGVTRTLTLHADVKAKLTDEQKATITVTKGWTLA